MIPTLMKSLGQTENLVSYLSNENMQQILVTGQSQAALNEQCEFGYNACSTKIGRYASAIFRFAVNRSMSRETEKMNFGIMNWKPCLQQAILNKHWH